MPGLASFRTMRRLVPASILVLVALAGCVPAVEFDPETGSGYAEMVAGFAAQSPEQQLETLAYGDASVDRSLWVGSGLEEALGGPDEADEVFAGLQAQLARAVDGVEADGAPIALASFTQSNVGEATGAGMFAGMLVTDLLTEAGMVASKGGETGEVTQDFGEGGTVTMSSAEDGVVTTAFSLDTEYKGVKITLVVQSEMNPCPDPDGEVDAKGVYQVVVTGPDGAGSSTQIDLDLAIQVNDDAQVGFSDYTYEAAYMTRPQAPGAVFDMTSSAVRFTTSSDGSDYELHERSFAALWSSTFELEAIRAAAFFAQWIAASLEKSAQKGWEDGRCIELQGAYSAGPKGLKPKATVTATLTPIAKTDGAPAGGTVTAELVSGVKAITPEGAKVDAPADFSYTASDKKDEEGTVRFESRSRRGVGILTVTFDTKTPQSYFMAGGGGDFYGEGFICDLNSPWSISGSGVVMEFSPSGGGGGSYSYSGVMGPAVVYGGEAYEVTYTDGEVTGIHGWGVGTVEVGGLSSSGGGDEYYTLTPIDRPADCG